MTSPRLKTRGEFTFADYVAEIDAGRVVILHVEGHSMFGYGYDYDTNSIFLHDTWFEDQQFMTWGGSYRGLDLLGVPCFEPTGGVVPIPSSILLLGSGLVGVVGFRKRWRK